MWHVTCFVMGNVTCHAELHKVPDPASLARRKYLAIPGSAENIYKNQAYEFIIAYFQLLEVRKPHIMQNIIIIICNLMFFLSV